MTLVTRARGCSKSTKIGKSSATNPTLARAHNLKLTLRDLSKLEGSLSGKRFVRVEGVLGSGMIERKDARLIIRSATLTLDSHESIAFYVT